MKIKEGAVAHPRHPALYFADGVVDAVCLARFGREAVLTSAVRPPTAGGSSLHPKGLAADYRTRDLSNEEQRALAEEVAEILGPEYDVVLEGPAAFHERYRDRVAHLHVEFDPKATA